MNKITWKGVTPVAGPSYWNGYLGDIKYNIRVFSIHRSMTESGKFNVTCLLPSSWKPKKPCDNEDIAKILCEHILIHWLERAGLQKI